MAKSDLTLTIERALRFYKPATLAGIKLNAQRGYTIAFEVPVENGTNVGGIVDCVRVSEYWANVKTERYCYYDTVRKGMRCLLALPDGAKTPCSCSETRCRYNCVKEYGDPSILIQCFEIKVTVSDFRSANGHNFSGNVNYYVVPTEIYHDIKDDVPEEIGIITYHHTDISRGFRRRKDATYQELSDEQQKWLLLNVMKRIRRGGGFSGRD